MENRPLVLCTNQEILEVGHCSTSVTHYLPEWSKSRHLKVILIYPINDIATVYHLVGEPAI
jgi:hypothetical protein